VLWTTSWRCDVPGLNIGSETGYPVALRGLPHALIKILWWYTTAKHCFHSHPLQFNHP
jgi:hypothetical protein